MISLTTPARKLDMDQDLLVQYLCDALVVEPGAVKKEGVRNVQGLLGMGVLREEGGSQGVLQEVELKHVLQGLLQKLLHEVDVEGGKTREHGRAHCQKPGNEY